MTHGDAVRPPEALGELERVYRETVMANLGQLGLVAVPSTDGASVDIEHAASAHHDFPPINQPDLAELQTTGKYYNGMTTRAWNVLTQAYVTGRLPLSFGIGAETSGPKACQLADLDFPSLARSIFIATGAISKRPTQTIYRRMFGGNAGPETLGFLQTFIVGRLVSGSNAR
jgi:hypothetical protein